MEISRESVNLSPSLSLSLSQSKGPLLRVVEFGVKQRTKLLHKPYGDQCLFFHRDAYESCRGFKRVPFMEVRRPRR